MPGGRRRGRKRAREASSCRPCLWPLPRSRRAPPREPAQIVQGRGPRGGTRGACAERRLLSRGRTPLSHLPDKHHENSAAHTVIAAPAAGRVSTSPFPRGESESEISPPPSSLHPPPAAAPAAPSRDALPVPPTAHYPRPVAPLAPPGSAARLSPAVTHPSPAAPLSSVNPSGRPLGLSVPRPRRPPLPCQPPGFCGSQGPPRFLP